MNTVTAIRMINDTLKLPCSMLFACAAISLYGALNLEDVAKDFSVNIFVTIIGIFVTVFLIDRVMEEEAEKKRRKILQIAFRKLPIEMQFILLMNMGRANAPNGAITNYSDLYNEKYYEYLKHLDISAKGHGRWNNGREMTWGEYITFICKQFKDSIDIIMRNYMIYLKTEELELFQSILLSNFLYFAVEGIPLQLTASWKQQSYKLFDRAEYNGTEEYLDLLKRLTELFNTYCRPEDIIRLT